MYDDDANTETTGAERAGSTNFSKAQHGLILDTGLTIESHINIIEAKVINIQVCY